MAIATQEALRRAVDLLERAEEETKVGGQMPKAFALASIAHGYIELARVLDTSA